MWKIPLFDLDFNHEEEQAVREVIKNKWLTSGDKTIEFENRFAEYLGLEVAGCAVSSGTAALHISLLACGIKAGDEVIIPALTFVADINVVLMTGAVPVLADIKSSTDWNIDPEDVEKKITSKTKAVIAVHYAGWPCDMDELTEVCNHHDLWLIEDAAHAPGAVYKGKKCGTIGDMGCFSFFSNKNLSTGEGGMITSRQNRHISNARLLRSHGMTRSTMERYKGGSLSYDVIIPGLNYRIDELKSALGMVQLKKLDRNNSKRLSLVHDYVKHLSPIEKMTIPWKNFPGDRQGSGHIFPIMLSEAMNRNELMDFLKKNGIQTSIHYPGFNEFSCFRNMFKSFPEIAATVSSKMVTLPLYPGLSKENTEFICTKIAEFLDQRKT